MRKKVKVVATTAGALAMLVIASYVAMVYVFWAITPHLDPVPEDTEDYAMYDKDIE